MPSRPNPIFRLLHHDYAESFAAYTPRMQDFHDPVIGRLPGGWTIRRNELWFYCSPPLHSLPAQGWKIHVSASVSNSREVLDKVVSVLARHEDVAFKFALDRQLLSLLNSKSWPRGGSGKFIAIYPSGSRRFLNLIEELAEATAGLQGPYILSDQRYKASRVVFYRYGGMRARTALNVKGEKVPVLVGPDGTLVPDQRLAYPLAPSWATPVLPVEADDGGKDEALCLKSGRYAIETAVAFSSAGGVYLARDNQTGQKVVVKEARPCINAAGDDYDAVELLKKEYRLLGILADTSIAPRPVDLFQEWENWFLVEEFIEGTLLSQHSAANNVLLRTRVTLLARREWCAMFRNLCAELIGILEILHSHNIVFADLSTNNLIIGGGDRGLRIIDFEGAHQPGIDRPANIYTPGFISQRRIAGGGASREDDYYAAGAVLLSYLLPINGLLHLNPRARPEFLAAISRDIQLPGEVADLINGLMECPELMVGAGHGAAIPGPAARPFDAADGGPASDYPAILNQVVAHVNGAAQYERKDRLYPGDPRVFSTNPLSLAYGAAGVAYALHKISGDVPEPVVDWILRIRIRSEEYPPGLYLGMSGIAWCLLEMGLEEPAEKVFRTSFRHPLLYQSADLFHGIAGWGMTGLRFFVETGNQEYLDWARQAGKQLLASAMKSERGYHWSSDGSPLGLAHGSSGIALFFLYLYLATEDESYMAAGLEALNFDLAAAVLTKDGGLSWPESTGSSSPLYPYWRLGSAGVGIATVRFQRLLKSPRHQSFLERIFIDADRKYAVLPGRFTGLAGVGEFLLDMHDLSGEQRFLDSAHQLAEGIMRFRVERNGTAFPGELLSRLSCDYGTGSAGIALFLNRLLGRQGSDFMLDGLFLTRLKPGRVQECSHCSQCRETTSGRGAPAPQREARTIFNQAGMRAG